MIKTINLTGSEIKVTELGGDNTEIFNNSSSIVYASKLPNITVGGDEVIAIPAGAIDGLYGTRGTVYLLGLGSVELRGVDHKITNSRGQSAEGNGECVSASYVGNRCNETLDYAKIYTDVKGSEVLVSAKEYADSINAELAGYVGYTDNDIYGLEVDFENCVFTRLAGAVGKTAGADFDRVNAYGGRRRCNLSDRGEVLAYYGDENFKADGSNGQVMVEQPKFYYRVVPLKTEKIDGADGYHLRKARYYISDTPKAGFKVHPAFVRSGVEVDKIYLSAFEGCIYDTSAGVYLLEDEQIADFGSDKLSSIEGAKPCSGQSQALTRANARKLAHNRGEGWEQAVIQTVSATQLLFIVEYADFNSQNTIGTGAVYKTNIGAVNTSDKTGITSSLGDSSGAVNNDSIQFVSYRGEENLWGNIWYFVDGINVSPAAQQITHIYIADNSFEDASCSAPYIDTALPLCSKNGFISSFGYSPKFDWVFVPSECVGNNKIPIGDSYRRVSGNNADWNILKSGGAWCDGINSGLFEMDLSSIPSARWCSFGTRLQYFPN